MKNIRIYILSIIILIILIYAFFSIGKPYKFPSSSMEPTIKQNELIFISQINYSNIQIGDIVCVESDKIKGYTWIRRVLGKPHDIIYWSDEGVYLPSQSFQNYPNVKNKKSPGDHVITLDKDEYFLSADKSSGIDSRHLGPFNSKDITGKVRYLKKK